MQFRFKNQGSHTYLVYEVLPPEELDSFMRGMLTNNKISGFADTVFTQMNETNFIYYDVSSMVSASELFSRTVNRKNLIGFLRGVADAFASAEEYMLDDKMIILDFDYIFINVATSKTVMIYLPVQGKDSMQKSTDVISFLKHILYNTKFDMNDDNTYIALLMNYFNSNSSFVPDSLKIFLNEIERVPNLPVNAPLPAASVPVQNVQNSNGFSPVSKPVFQEEKKEKNSANSGFSFSSKKSPKLPNNPSMVIPDMDKNFQKKITDSSRQSTDGEEIGLLYLLQHYNKENAMKYKTQKEAKKKKKKEIVNTPVQNNKNQGFVPGSVSTQPGYNAAPKQMPPMRVLTPQAPVPFAQNPMPAQEQKFSERFNGTNPNNNISANPVPNMNVAAPAFNAYSQEKQAGLHRVLPFEQAHIDFGGTSVLGDGMANSRNNFHAAAPPFRNNISESETDGKTVLLNFEDNDATVLIEQKVAYLIRLKNKERILLDKPVFLIGRNLENLNYDVRDNLHVGHRHASITRREILSIIPM